MRLRSASPLSREACHSSRQRAASGSPRLSSATSKVVCSLAASRGPDPDTGCFDLRAIDAWLDSQSGLTTEGASRDVSSRLRSKLEARYGKVE